MVNIKEIQNLTYKDSKWIQSLRKKFDKKIKRAARRGHTSVFISIPVFHKDANVFLSTAKEYDNNGYKVEVEFEHWKVNGKDIRITKGIEIFWEKSING